MFPLTSFHIKQMRKHTFQSRNRVILRFSLQQWLWCPVHVEGATLRGWMCISSGLLSRDENKHSGCSVTTISGLCNCLPAACLYSQKRGGWTWAPGEAQLPPAQECVVWVWARRGNPTPLARTRAGLGTCPVGWTECLLRGGRGAPERSELS